MTDEEDVIERIVTLKGIDSETCKKLEGLHDEKEGVCKVRTRERKSRPGEIEIIKLRREDVELR